VDQRERVLELLRRHGWNATSFQSLEPEFCYWFDGDDAAVAYFDTGGAWVVAGPPIAPEERLASSARRFARHAAAHGKRVAFFAVEERFLRGIEMRSIVIGQQPAWNALQWPERHRGHRRFKEQLRRARAKGVTVERLDADAVQSQPVRSAIEQLIDRWRSSRAMPPMTFLVELSPFGFAGERRYYVARVREELMGVLVAVPVYQRDGWFFENILRDPQAPNGTTESLVNAAMLDVAASGASYVTLGLAPLAGEERWLRITRAAMQGFYNFEGLYAFKAKLRPDRWDPIYLAWPDGASPVVAVYDALDAFAGGKLVRFGLRSIFRAPSSVLFTLGALLVPWTAWIAIADSWFPSRRIQFAWVAFDVVMCGAFVSLSSKWRRPLAIGACVAASADAALTSIEAAAYNVPRARRLEDWFVIGAAVAAPALAAAILFGGLLTRSE
jgi:phosphatidylglycerol lysyltransferase